MSDRGGARPAALPILRRALTDGWRGLLGWTVGLAAVALLYLPLFPSMQSPELTDLLDSLPPALVETIGYQNIGTGSGYTQATFFGLIGYVLLTIAAITWGAALIGGAEESGRLELTLAHGVGRASYALQSAAALIVKLAWLGLAAWLIIWALNGPAQLDLDAGKLWWTVAAWVGVGLVSATAALAAGGLTGRRAWSVGAGAGVAVAGYTLQAVANNSADLDGLRRFSPFDWAFGNAPLTNGLDGGGLALLLGVSALLIAVATLGLARRDVLG
ncbi:ABC transporter permease subunit [uncultured Microbacterium sp.]|uniref:ABC-2 type transporter n=1 Tax=uncultured Microbacterium sp. TaxID=191216 RepID=A0A1Y5NX78_9MICO|nr:ABC transporter permease subunit [uncultured Microbacterium sp.]SBS70974.1 ABC-2 type transporter [uncultured Microbacterium sp.]